VSFKPDQQWFPSEFQSIIESSVLSTMPGKLPTLVHEMTETHALNDQGVNVVHRDIGEDESTTDDNFIDWERNTRRSTSSWEGRTVSVTAREKLSSPITGLKRNSCCNKAQATCLWKSLFHSTTILIFLDDESVPESS
jgi:hypothetical protein